MQRRDDPTVVGGPPGLSRRKAEVEGLLNEIIDPCSGATGVPIGLVDMGIVRRIDIQDGEVTISLLPTFGGCLFVPLFEEEMRTRLEELEWCRSVRFEALTGREIWTEDLMRSEARARLAQSRSRRRMELPLVKEARSR
jgi:metal-sulfur cluster biosynthetic enzyme